MMDNGQKVDSTVLSKEDCEAYLKGGLLSMESLMQRAQGKSLTWQAGDLLSIIDALDAQASSLSKMLRSTMSAQWYR